MSFIFPFHKSNRIAFRHGQSCSDLFILSGFLSCLPQDAAKFSKGSQVLKMRLSYIPFQKISTFVCLLSFLLAKDKIDGIKQRTEKLQQHLKIHENFNSKVPFPWQTSEWSWQQCHFLWKMCTWGRIEMFSCQGNIYEKLYKSCLNSCQLCYVHKTHSLDFKNISRQEIKNYSNACQHYLLNAKAFQWPLLSDVNYASDNTAFQVPAKTKPVSRYLPRGKIASLYNSVNLLTTLHTKFRNNPLEVAVSPELLA